MMWEVTKAWFEFDELKECYDKAFRISDIKLEIIQMRMDDPIDFESIFSEALGKVFDEVFGKYWVIKPSLQHYGLVMCEEACEEYYERRDAINE